MSSQSLTNDGSNFQAEPGLSFDENLLLNSPLPHDLNELEAAHQWEWYQSIIGTFLVRMGAENPVLDSLARVALPGNVQGIATRLALLPMFSNSAFQALRKAGIAPTQLMYRLGGECRLMELSAAAGYRTFCLPDLVRGLLKTNKMRDNSVQRMMDTFEFLNTMVQLPYHDSKVVDQFGRTNHLHGKYKVAGAQHQRARDLFKYIALNMFYVGPMMRDDLTPQERYAICGLTVLVSKRMGHAIQGTVKELEKFIVDYENEQMFARDDQSTLRRKAVEIAQASKLALDRIPSVSPARIHSYVPYRVKKILEIE